MHCLRVCSVEVDYSHNKTHKSYARANTHSYTKVVCTNIIPPPVCAVYVYAYVPLPLLLLSRRSYRGISWSNWA